MKEYIFTYKYWNGETWKRFHKSVKAINSEEAKQKLNMLIPDAERQQMLIKRVIFA